MAVLVSFANITAIAAALLGEDAALSIIQLLSNILFAVLAGYLISESFRSTMRLSVGAIPLMALGTASILALTFGFPVFAVSYLPSLLDWMTADGAGLPALIVLTLIEAVLGGSAVAALGVLMSAAEPTPKA